MNAWVEAVTLAGSTLRVAAPGFLPAEPDTLAVASAIRVFDRFQALDTLLLAGGDGDVHVTRAEVERLLAPDGFAALHDRGRWPQLLARALQRHASARPEGAA
jgi:hypothetical protein